MDFQNENQNQVNQKTNNGSSEFFLGLVGILVMISCAMAIYEIIIF